MTYFQREERLRNGVSQTQGYMKHNKSNLNLILQQLSSQALVLHFTKGTTCILVVPYPLIDQAH